MAGTVIVDYIQAAGSTLSMNVGNTLVLTANASGLTYTPTNNVNINVGSTTSMTMGNVTVTSNVTTSNLKVTTGIAIGSATPQTGGIAFPATAIAVANANTLDDYEEGTWTPTYSAPSGSAGSAAYTSSGYYIKIGNFLSLYGTITVSNKGSWVGKILIAGAPFTSSFGAYPGVSVGNFENYTTNVLSVSGYVNGSGGQIIPLHQTAASTNNAETYVTNISTGWRYDFSCVIIL